MAKRKLEYKGRSIEIDENAGKASVSFEKKTYKASKTEGDADLWETDKLYNRYGSLEDLAKDLVNHHYML